jgi:Nif-specific regulatory protein/two-component system response regulator HydG
MSLAEHRRAFPKTETRRDGAVSTALLLGETGTGKELMGQALHCNSPCGRKRLVTPHCTALPGTILESELFDPPSGGRS